MNTCPCCGQGLEKAVPAAVTKAISRIHLTQKHQRLVTILARRMGQWFSADQIANALYDEADGGPNYARQCVAVFVCHMRPKLRSVGLTIEGASGRGGGRRLVWAK